MKIQGNFSWWMEILHYSQDIHHPRRPRGSKSGRQRKGATKVEEPLGTDSHRTISKRSRECWHLIGHKKCFVLLCPIGEQFLLSSFREFLHDVYYLATFARFIHQAFLTTNEGTTDDSKNVSDAISRTILHWENSVSDASQCIVNNRKFKMRQRRESKESSWQGKTTTLHYVTCITLFCTFLCLHGTTTTWGCLILRFVKDVNKQ